jgi:hypothetical protein
MDIRNFFKGISLPPGRVHIIGGDKGEALIAFSSDEDARQAMMLNMGYIGDSQIFLFLIGTAEMRRRIREANIHSSASGRSFAEPAPAQQAVSASQPQQLPLQQDSFWGTQFTHTIDHKGQGYIGRGPEEPVVGVQDSLMYRQQLSGAQEYGGQITSIPPNEYGSRILTSRKEYNNPVAGYKGDEPIPHLSQDKGTKRPHQDESGQSPPLTGTAKRMKTTIRCREIITKL